MQFDFTYQPSPRQKEIDYSIDDRHQAALATFGDGSIQARILNSVYGMLLDEYGAWVDALSTMTEWQ